MATSRKPRSKRAPLTRERVLRAAFELADEQGVDKLSMRQLGKRLGVEAMSLYNHVSNKDDILDGMVDMLVAEIDKPLPEDGWREGMWRRAVSARAVFRRHPWGIALLESRSNPGFETLRYHDAVLGCLRRGGFSVELAAHAFAVLDAFIFGFALEESQMPTQGEDLAGMAEGMAAQLPVDELPYFVELVTQHVLKPGYSYSAEFEWGLELILDGLERRRDEA